MDLPIDELASLVLDLLSDSMLIKVLSDLVDVRMTVT